MSNVVHNSLAFLKRYQLIAEVLFAEVLEDHSPVISFVFANLIKSNHEIVPCFFLPLSNNMVCHRKPPLKYIAFFQPGDAVWSFRNIHSGAKIQGMVPDLLILQLIENRKNMCNLFLKL